eukprot:TRINITY_DN8632_c0_g1_i15.p1 TRINITY_DN8632_c0_g1~~TRINITY_DN8632_c0_g1_i15.p1  ORF type:complete len:112 (+),score=0.01 TRINITY_DN8632_c0_g1_i15:783-1118(+)
MNTIALSACRRPGRHCSLNAGHSSGIMDDIVAWAQVLDDNDRAESACRLPERHCSLNAGHSSGIMDAIVAWADVLDEYDRAERMSTTQQHCSLNAGHSSERRLRAHQTTSQ